jgi:acyl carrier protein phosphodiesterase
LDACRQVFCVALNVTAGLMIVRCSKQRVSTPFRKFSGILVDVFYDHLLANEWHKHSQIPLNQFIAEVYTSIDALPAEIPAMARLRLEQMRTEDWLSSYGHMDGLRLTLVRVGRRLRKPVDLGIAITDLQADFQAFQNDFQTFFPELRDHVGQQYPEN